MEYKEFVTKVATALGVEKRLPESFDKNITIRSTYGSFKVTFWYTTTENQYCEVHFGNPTNIRGFYSHYKFSVATDNDDKGNEKIHSFTAYPENKIYDPQLVVEQNIDGAFFYIGDDIAVAVARAAIANR